MTTSTQFIPTLSSSSRAEPAATAQRTVEVDRGPWLFLVAPATFALTLATIIYLSRISF